MKKWKMSQLIIVYMLVIFFLFMGIIVYLNVFVLRDIQDRECAKEQDMLENWVNIWDNMLENNTIYINNFMANNGEVTRLHMAKDSQERLFAMQEIKSTLNEYALLNNGMAEIFYFFRRGDETVTLTNDTMGRFNNSTLASQRVQNILNAYLESGGANRWAIEKVNGQNTIIYVCEKNGDYLGCWCSVDYLINEATKTSHSTCRFFIADEDGTSRTDSYLEGEAIDLDAGEFRSPSGGDYWQITQKSRLINIYFLEHIEKSEIGAAVRRVEGIMIGVCVFLGIFLVFLSGLFERFLYRPIRGLVAHMSQIAQGDFETKITEDTHLKEIYILNETFNTMLDEIQDLKIEVYEEQLKEQKTQLRHLQMQIRPHFLVNALDCLRSMIQVGQLEAAGDMCFYLAKFYRFLYSKNVELIVLAEELEQIENYASIQKLRWPDRAQFHAEIADECRCCLIPPLLVESFVENSFKYGIDPKSSDNRIAVKVFSQDGCTNIVVRDNGPGFSGQVLSDYYGDRPIQKNGQECVGLRNAQERLRLFFGEQAELRLYNEGGAVVEIKIPNFGTFTE